MARRSHTAVLKRQRELRKAEKASLKRAKRHGKQVGPFVEPRPTVRLSDQPEGSDTPDESDDTMSTKEEVS